MSLGILVRLNLSPYWTAELEHHEVKSEDEKMSGPEILQSVQFVTIKGRRLAVLSIEGWEALIEWLETLEDVQVARQALGELKAAGGDRRRAGWLEWKSVAGEIE